MSLPVMRAVCAALMQKPCNHLQVVLMSLHASCDYHAEDIHCPGTAYTVAREQEIPQTLQVPVKEQGWSVIANVVEALVMAFR